MVFEVTGSSCEGYSVTFRLVNRYSYREGNTRLVDVQSSSFEAGDATRFDYQEKEFIDSAAGQEKRTVVERPQAGGDAQGEIKQPEAKTFTIPAGALFPMQHQLKVVDAALAGQKRFVADVFDGSDGINSVQAIATIGNRVEPGQGKDKGSAEAKPLLALASWPVTIAYFQPGSAEDTPNFQISFSLYENGIATNMVLDYGNLALTGRLSGLELLKADECK